MKENIERIAKLITTKFNNDYSIDNVDKEVIEELLKAYKELKEIEESHRKENGKLRERVKELEEERQIVGMPVRNKRDGRIGIVLHQWKSGSVAVLESINPRVINTHDSWNTLEIVTDEVKQTQTKCETIPVSLVEEKIEEIQKEYEETLKTANFKEIEKMNKINFRGITLEGQRSILRELLEKRK